MYGPQETPLPEVVRVCDRRWAIEEGFAEAKGEVGLDHYEVRTWTAWHRFITLGLLAHAALVVLRQRAFAAEASVPVVSAQKGGLGAPAFRSPSPKSAAWFWRCASRTRSGRSGWRGRTGGALTRRRQPAATLRGGCQESQRVRPVKAPSSQAVVPPAPVPMILSDAAWDRIRPLLPPQKPVDWPAPP